MQNAAATQTVLVVDDDRGLGRLIEKSLRRSGYTVAKAYSGAEAIAWRQEHAADLMLVDLKLPDMGGEELVSRLTEGGQAVPFIIITGQGDERVAVDMMKRGALDYLVKDVDFLEFVPAVVERAVAQLERERRLAIAERERRHLQEEIVHISDREQQRIGQDLHDGICQILAGIDMVARVLKNKLVTGSPNEAAQAEIISTYARRAMAQSRLLARGLSPLEMGSHGLMVALQDLAAYTRQLFQIDCVFICDPPVLMNDNTRSTHLYRIAQEATNNAVKHAQAKKITITLTREDEGVLVCVEDDGRGMPADYAHSSGMGLKTMQYRAQTIGARLEILPNTPCGTMVRVTLE